jgi:hypothetical protein
MYETLKKLAVVSLLAIALFSFSGVLAQDGGSIVLPELYGDYDLGWCLPNDDPSIREVEVTFPESFNPSTCQVELAADYLFGVWDCLDGANTPPPALVNIEIDHPSEGFDKWAASFEVDMDSGLLPPVSDFYFGGNPEHSWADLAGQTVTVSLLLHAYTWPECTLVEDYKCTVNAVTLVYDSTVDAQTHPWSSIKALYR